MSPDKIERDQLRENRLGAAPSYAAERIRQSMGDLPAAERRVARALLSDYPTAGLEPAAQLAARARTSAPTVTRYIARLGYAGYREFQQTLREELQARTSSPMTTTPKYTPQSPLAGLLADTGRVDSDLLRSSFDSLPPSEFEAAVDLLVDPRRRVTSIGGRFSHVLAELLDLHLRMMRAHTYWRLVTPETSAIARIESDRRDSFVVFDFRRYQRDVVECARAVHERGAKIILITDPWLSPIAEFAEVVLPLHTDNESSFDSVVPAVALVEALATAILTRLGPDARSRVRLLDRDVIGVT